MGDSHPQNVVFFFFQMIYLFLAVLGLRCQAFSEWAFSGCSKQGLIFVVVHGLLVAVASVGAEYRLWGMWASVVVAHRLSCPETCGIFPDQGSNPCSLHWQADSQPLGHHRSPKLVFILVTVLLFRYPSTLTVSFLGNFLFERLFDPPDHRKLPESWTWFFS
ncbi:unnamed protein product [Rangifer tarandus platyrhynchus]|uniref:Uncharacterized protein n=2 Tax=Rangifer tarandus platyrhynchus TaxID=3082113 RepID=A0AC59Y1F6_RANTA|nr:unnamed protein product [Rangifer tarandus platyrhynchus]